MFRLDTKLSRIRAGQYRKGDFILADAKDGDMANPITRAGPVRAADGSIARFRTRAEVLDQITEVIRQDRIDIMLTSAANLEKLKQDGAFEGSAIKPAFRANDTTDIWSARPDGYAGLGPSRPFRTASLARIAEADLTDLCLYSITFNNSPEDDLRALESFNAFREDAAVHGIRYFLEVFNPNVDTGIPPEALGAFVNDNLTRCLAGVLQANRPRFLKIPFNGAAALEELVAYDPGLVVGVLGGSAGTARDAFELIWQAEKYGARGALFGPKINLVESQTDIVEFMRLVADGELTPLDAVEGYHAALVAKELRPLRSLEEDSAVTEAVLKPAASA